MGNHKKANKMLSAEWLAATRINVIVGTLGISVKSHKKTFSPLKASFGLRDRNTLLSTSCITHFFKKVSRISKA